MIHFYKSKILIIYKKSNDFFYLDFKIFWPMGMNENIYFFNKNNFS
jgi:hypothetical protein